MNPESLTDGEEPSLLNATTLCHNVDSLFNPFRVPRLLKSLQFPYPLVNGASGTVHQPKLTLYVAYVKDLRLLPSVRHEHKDTQRSQNPKHLSSTSE